MFAALLFPQIHILPTGQNFNTKHSDIVKQMAQNKASGQIRFCPNALLYILIYFKDMRPVYLHEPDGPGVLILKC